MAAPSEAVIPADPRPQGLALAHLARRHHRRALRHQRRRRHLGRRLLDPEARARPRGRHADHPRSRRSRPAQTVSQEQLDQAVSIIRQRVDASGVSEAEINTQGASNIVVRIPGELDDADPRRASSRRRSSSCAPCSLADAADEHASIGDDASSDAAPDARPRARADADGGADQRQRPRVDHAGAAGGVRRLRLRVRSTTTRRTSLRPTSRSSPATSTAPSSTSSARSRSSGENIVRRHQRHGARRRPAPAPASGPSTSSFDDAGHRGLRRRSATRLYGLQGQRRANQFAFVLDGQRALRARR